MTPEVGLLGVTKFNWPSFRSTIDKVLKLRPDTDLNALPVDFSDDALVLLNVAAYYGWSVSNPLHVLRNLPITFMPFLGYQFFIACDIYTWEEFNPSSGLSTIKREIPEGLLIIATGSLDAWYQTITCNLGRDWEYRQDTRILFCKLMLTFEKERGLHLLFEKYKKKMQPDHTFLLEQK